MAIISVPNTFSANTTISSSEVNANFSTIYNEFNGSITAANLATDSVTTAKIADSAVTSAKIANGAVVSERLGCTIAAKAYASTNQSITSGALRKVTLDTESYDVGSDFDSATNYRFVAPVTGYYQTSAQVEYSNIGGGEQIIIYLQVNGTPVASSKSYVPTTNDDPAVSISDLIYMTAGQYIELYTQCTSTKSLNGGQVYRNFLSIYHVGS